jgi:two-component system chemotaxis response regulator CheY
MPPDRSIQTRQVMPSAIIIDDSPIMRTQLGKLVALAGFSVVAQAGSADDLLALYEQHRPELLTLDIVMPGRDGATAGAELLARHPRAVVVMCTSLNTRDKVEVCRRAGVKGYLLKPFNPDYAVSVFRRGLQYSREMSLPEFEDAPAPGGSTRGDGGSGR